MSSELLSTRPDVGQSLQMLKSLPRFYSPDLRNLGGLLGEVGTIVVERKDASVARMVSDVAARDGIPTLSHADVRAGRLTHAAEPASPVGHRSPARQPGPYAERTDPNGSVDWSFVVHEKSRGWILDAICREIGSRQPSSWNVCYYPSLGPPARNYFFSHYSLFERFLQHHADTIADARTFVWYTHPRIETPESIAKLLAAFGQATCVVFTCESNRSVWLGRGLDRRRTAVILGGADPDFFPAHDRGDGAVGLSSSFYERKDPDRTLEIVKRLPHRPFLLLGRHWNRYALFEEMRELDNFSYVVASYEGYPEVYAKFDVFLSPSRVEGGPIPLLEAMMSNAVPVVSRTGFAPDLIQHGVNGYIFDVDAPADEVADLIEQAFRHRGSIRSSVEQYSWVNFSASIIGLSRDAE